MYTNGTETRTYKQLQADLNISFPRDNPPDGWTVYAPEPALLTLEQRRENQRQSLKQQRIGLVSAPINNVQVAKPDDRENVQWAAANVQTIDWIMADNTIQTLTASELQAVIDTYPLRKMQLFSIYAGLLQQLQSSDNPESITWPE